MIDKRQMTQTDNERWLELLRECILHGMLFKAAMWDLAMISRQPLKISYRAILEELSRWAEREHNRIKATLRQNGYELAGAQKQGGFYAVRFRERGYYREAVYSVEVLRSECHKLVDRWVEQRREGSR
ncbi:MAG TPA: hypothetical protein VE710_21920 [Candidatus Bathyarchaeia archaeon]|nr:hypothetical protein [Candidatus Bathyarchaeia archaeon]